MQALCPALKVLAPNVAGGSPLPIARSLERLCIGAAPAEDCAKLLLAADAQYVPLIRGLQGWFCAASGSCNGDCCASGGGGTGEKPNAP